jgi:hypothetical protein
MKKDFASATLITRSVKRPARSWAAVLGEERFEGYADQPESESKVLHNVFAPSVLQYPECGL